jgi:tRNA A37 threonylcarbamoyladenosine dehydratase
MNDVEVRFGAIARLIGQDGLDRMRHAHVGVVGIGGVGSWAVEALARSGIGALTLVDLDEVCVTNINRQIHALDGAVGRPKVEVMAERVRAIHPDCRVQAVPQFFTEATANEILQTHFDALIDAIDTVSNKCRLIAECRSRNIPMVVCGGAGGRRDPTQVRVADLADTTHDHLLQKVRERLRKEYGFPRGGEKFGVDCVFSREPPVHPRAGGSVCAKRDPGAEPRLNCDRGYGTASFVTGTFGFTAAARVIAMMCGGSIGRTE